MSEQTLVQNQTHSCSESASNASRQRSCVCNVRPVADVVEATDSVVLFVELPGVLPEHLEVAVENGVVDITATSERTLPEGFHALGAEQARKYFRQFKLAETLDSTHMQAEFKNGLLKLVVPRRPENRRQKIAINTTV